MPNQIFGPRNVMFAEIRDLAAAQNELERLLRAVSPDQGLRSGVTLALGQLHRYATGIIHVVTSRLKNSLFWEMTGESEGVVATNVDYALAEENRGGNHAFFGRTVAEEGPNVPNFIFNVVKEYR